MALNAVAGPLARERKTIDAMVAIYCRDHHGRHPHLCAGCDALRTYAEQRLVHCPFGSDKPTCANCQVHCYRAEMRERVKGVMRYAGPKMLVRHPILAILHLWVDSRRDARVRPARRSSSDSSHRAA